MNKENNGAAVLKKAKRIGGFLIDVIKYTFGFLSGKVKTFVSKKLGGRSVGQALKEFAEKTARSVGSFDFKSVKPREIISSVHPVTAAAGAVVGVFLVFWIAFGTYTSHHFLTGTQISGVDVSGMTVGQAEDAITEAAGDYTLTVFEKDGVTETISASDINMTVEISKDFRHILKRRSGYSWVKAIFGNKSVNADGLITYKYDSGLFNEKVSSLRCLHPEKVTEPVDAELYFHDGVFEIRPSVTGSMADESRLKTRIADAVEAQERTINLETDGIYAMPSVLTNDAVLNAKRSAFNGYAAMTITLRFGKHDHVIDQEEITSWLAFDENGAVSIDASAVKSSADSLSALHSTFSSPKEFVTHSGETVTLSNSSYGWRLDTDYAAEMLKGYAEKKQPVTVDLTDGSEESDKWWINTAVSYDSTRYYGNTYAEVSIDGQYMWMYRNGEVVLESDVVTGMPDSEHDTPPGAYCITYMEQNATLRGEDYETEVAYWMVFTTDIGFHDADWQWAFGDDMYIDNGSHGCVNLPIETAEELYSLVYVGMPVFVY